MKARRWIFLSLILTLGSISGAYFIAKPRLQAWIQNEVRSYSERELPFKISFAKVDWSLLLPKVFLDKVAIQFANTPGLDGASIDRIEAQLDVFALLGGQIRLSNLIFENAETNLQLDPWLGESQGPTEIPVDLLMKWLPRIPISRIILKDANVQIQSDKLKLNAKLDSTQALIGLKKTQLLVQLALQNASIQYSSLPETPFQLDVDSIVYKNALDVYSIKLTSLGSYIESKVAIENLKELLIKPNGSAEIDGFADLSKVRPALNEFKKVPEMQGTLKVDGRVELQSKGIPNGGFKFLGKSIKIDQFEIGDLDFSGKLEKDKITVPRLRVTSEAGQLDATDLNFDFSEKDQTLNVDVSGDLKSEFFDLNEFLKRIGVGSLPLEAFLVADTKCKGSIIPRFSIDCLGEIGGEQIEVRTSESRRDVLLQLEKVQAKGAVGITTESVNFKTDVTLSCDSCEDNFGKVDGIVDYNRGFKINYNSQKLDFKNVGPISGLKIEGTTTASGTTQGDSTSATFFVDVDATKGWFENFYLGNPKGRIRYASGNLYFEGVNGILGNSTYQTDFRIHFADNKIYLKGSSPRLELPDLLSVLERIFVLPVNLTGAGPVNVDLSGPLQLGKLSYKLDAKILQGSVAGESFDNAEFSFVAENGNVRTERAILRKNRSNIEMQGTSDPKGNIVARIQGKNFRLEESDNISKLGANIFGNLDFSMNLDGHILSPDTLLTTKLENLTLDQQEFPSSEAKVKFSRQTIEGEARLLGDRLTGSFVFPLDKQAPFRLNVIANNWNYTTLFALIGGGDLLNDYQAGLSGKIDLTSERGGIFTASGQGSVSVFTLRRGALSLVNEGPMSLQMKEGQIVLNNFRLQGSNTFVELRGQNFRFDDLNVRVSADANLRLFQIFLPFLEDLAGRATASMTVTDHIFKPEILGTANVSDGYVKIKGFPHAFERIRSQTQFSQRRVLIDKISGNLAGGNFSGDGNIRIEGVRNLPLQIRAKLENATFLVPDKVRTQGDADVAISGNWFPFNLSGSYRVRGGLFAKEFTDEGSGLILKQSAYLPKTILDSAFEPLILDLQVTLERPIQVRNSMIEGNAVGNLQIRGAPTRPLLFGKVSLDKQSKLMFRDKTFEVNAATVDFNDTEEINPELYVSARSRINDYDITLLAQGKSKNPTIRLTSLPPLAENDIISLLALGITSQKLEKKTATSEQEKGTYNELGAAILANTPISKKIQQNLGVDFLVSSQYDDTKNIAVQKFTMVKKIGSKVKASASRLAGQQESTEVKLQYSFDQNFSAVGSYENREASEPGKVNSGATRESQSILGLDLEFKKEFK